MWFLVCLQVLQDELIVAVSVFVFAGQLCVLRLFDPGVASYVDGRCDNCVVHTHAEGGVIHLCSGDLIGGRGGDKDMVW